MALSTKEKTGQQTVGIHSYSYDDVLEKEYVSSGDYYKKIREIRKHPTISLCRRMMIAPVTRAGLSFEASPHTKQEITEDHIEYVQRVIEPLQFYMLRQAMAGCLDFGWQPFEKVFELRDNELLVRKLKPLLQDYTRIRITRDTGAFDGFKQEHIVDSTEKIIEQQNALLFNFDVEGTSWYGTSTLRCLEKWYDDGVQTTKSAARYDKKHAGAHWVIKFPVGSSTVDGKDTPNEEIADMIHANIAAGGGISIPQDLHGIMADLEKDNPAWDIQLISAPSGSATSYTDRFKYLDSLFVRGFGFPERTFTEGKFGTKAEAEAHAEFGLLNVEDRFQELANVVNWYLIDQLMSFQFGEDFRGAVVATPNPLVESERQMFLEIYKQLLAKPEVLQIEMDEIDLRQIRENAGIPTRNDDDESLLDDLFREEPEEDEIDDPIEPTNGNRLAGFWS